MMTHKLEAYVRIHPDSRDAGQLLSELSEFGKLELFDNEYSTYRVTIDADDRFEVDIICIGLSGAVNDWWYEDV